MKKVLTFGTFDLLHYGHIRLLKRAREYGDYLIIGLSSDDFALYKGKKTYFNYEQRKEILNSIKYVDEIIYTTSFEHERELAKELKPDVFVIGDDYAGKFNELKKWGIEVVYLERTPEISTSEIKNNLKK